MWWSSSVTVSTEKPKRWTSDTYNTSSSVCLSSARKIDNKMKFMAFNFRSGIGGGGFVRSGSVCIQVCFVTAVASSAQRFSFFFFFFV